MTIDNSSVASEEIDMTVSCDKKIDDSPKDKTFFETQKNFLSKCVTEKLTVGDSWYVLKVIWFNYVVYYF